MNSHVADDFHAALMVLQELDSDGHFEMSAEHETVQLVDEVFAFLENIGPAGADDFEPFEKIAA